MIRIAKHISHVIEAPYLDKDTQYYAKLWSEDGEEGDVVESRIETIDESESIVVFEFPSSYFDQFSEGDVLGLTLWNEQQTQDWRQRRVYRIVDSHVENG